MSHLPQRKIKRYGWKPSLPDQRDFHADTSLIKIAPEVDPRDELPEVFDQGDLGSCTANAIAGAVEYDARLSGKDFGTPSRLFIYYGERQIEGTVNEDSGAYGRDGFHVCRKTGVPPEGDWPYDISKFTETPPARAYEDAPTHKIGPYKSVRKSVTSIKRVLSNRQTVAFGFTVYESFETREVAKTGVVPLPGDNEQVLGGHEVLAVGYLKDEPNYVLVRNSWGSDWGIGGYFLFPWAYLIGPLSDDLRTIYRPLGK